MVQQSWWWQILTVQFDTMVTGSLYLDSQCQCFTVVGAYDVVKKVSMPLTKNSHHVTDCQILRHMVYFDITFFLQYCYNTLTSHFNMNTSLAGSHCSFVRNKSDIKKKKHFQLLVMPCDLNAENVFLFRFCKNLALVHRLKKEICGFPLLVFLVHSF